LICTALTTALICGRTSTACKADTVPFAVSITGTSVCVTGALTTCTALAPLGLPGVLFAYHIQIPAASAMSKMAAIEINMRCLVRTEDFIRDTTFI
jgi:hypothetical protein